jgi:formylglycine-generating enzyme required for sulfatase activity
MGSTPCEIFLPEGNRVIDLVLPGFNPYRIETVIQSRVLGSFIVQEHIRGELQEEAPGAALLLGAADFAAWSFAGEPTASYQIPQSLSGGVYRSYPVQAAAYPRLNGILRGAARFTTTRSSLRDLIRAEFLLDNGGQALSPLTLTSSLSDMASFIAETPGAAAWLAELLPAEAASRITDSAWYKRTVSTAELMASAAAVQMPGAGAFGGSLELASLSFREVAGGTLVQGAAFPHRKSIGSFLIAETEVNAASWEAFLGAHPEWKADNRPSLIQQGLVTSDYLQRPVSPPAGGADSAPGISWYAAKAYCRWLEELLPPAMAGYEVRLPTEGEWEYAAKLADSPGSGSPAGGGVTDMLAGLWEWCEDPYAPLNFFPAEEAIIRALSSPERSLRGGSWINPQGSVNAETRASLPPDTCSPFVSFRPVIAPKTGGSL